MCRFASLELKRSHCEVNQKWPSSDSHLFYVSFCSHFNFKEIIPTMRFEFATNVLALLVADIHDLCYADKQKRERLLRTNEKLSEVDKNNRSHRSMFLDQRHMKARRRTAVNAHDQDEEAKESLSVQSSKRKATPGRTCTDQQWFPRACYS